MTRAGLPMVRLAEEPPERCAETRALATSWRTPLSRFLCRRTFGYRARIIAPLRTAPVLRLHLRRAVPAAPLDESTRPTGSAPKVGKVSRARIASLNLGRSPTRPAHHHPVPPAHTARTAA